MVVRSNFWLKLKRAKGKLAHCLKISQRFWRSMQPEMSLSATYVQPKSVTIYKVVAGLDGTLFSFNSEQQSSYQKWEGDPDLQVPDWRALYTQFQCKHVLGTVPYRWEDEETEATFVSATFDDLEIVVLEGDLMHDGSVSGEEKALAVKRLLKVDEELPLMVDEELPLMQMLGKKGKVALVKETDDEWELLIPHDLLSKLSYTEHK
eukprot:3515401-Amphidinium_carterae.1